MATLKTTTINDTGHLTLPVGTTAQRPATPSQGMMRYNTTIGAAEEYTGSTWKRLDNLVSATATGAAYSQDIDDAGIPYRVHVWYGNGTFVPTTSGIVEYLIVGGGGGGGGGNPSADGNGGGGGGGLLRGTVAVTPQTYNIAVGSGGNGGAASPNSPGSDGGSSSAFGLTAVGGGGGGSDGSVNGRTGGSGGGASTSGSGGVGGSATAGQGNAGGSANAPGGAGPGGGGGGGGTAGYASGAGGSGIVVVRYRRNSGTLTVSPEIPTDGLVYRLDAGDIDSYKYGSDFGTWRDTSGKGVNFTFNGTQTYSYRYGGAIIMDGSTNYFNASYNATHMDFRYGQTLVGWIEPTTNTGRRNLHGQAYAGSGTLTHEPAGEINYYFGTGGENNSPYVGRTSPFTILAGEGPCFYAVSRNQRHNYIAWYKNDGSENISDAGGYDLTTNSGSRIQIGLDYTGTYWQGWIYMQLCYNRGLGPLEIQQIYNATKGRFGK